MFTVLLVLWRSWYVLMVTETHDIRLVGFKFNGVIPNTNRTQAC